MKKIDFKERVNSLRQDTQKQQNNNPGEKECPFSGKVCSERCKLFRSNKEAYECPFQEIPSMSWNLKSLIKKLIG